MILTGGLAEPHSSLHNMCHRAPTVSLPCHSCYSEYTREFDHDTLPTVEGKKRMSKEIDVFSLSKEIDVFSLPQ